MDTTPLAQGPLPTAEAIAERFNARLTGDMLGFEVGEYLDYLPYEAAKPYLKDGVTAEQWERDGRASHTREAVLERMSDYMSFAFEKANGQRGISASRSILHYVAWTWLAGDAALSEQIEQIPHEYYGKPTLRRICEHYGWDWKQWDNGVLTNGDTPEEQV